MILPANRQYIGSAGKIQAAKAYSLKSFADPGGIRLGSAGVHDGASPYGTHQENSECHREPPPHGQVLKAG